MRDAIRTNPTPCIFYSWFSSGISLWALPYNLLMLYGIWPYYAHFHMEFSPTETHTHYSIYSAPSLSFYRSPLSFSPVFFLSLSRFTRCSMFFQCFFFYIYSQSSHRLFEMVLTKKKIEQTSLFVMQKTIYVVGNNCVDVRSKPWSIPIPNSIDLHF